MKVGDLVIRSPDAEFSDMRIQYAKRKNKEMGPGLVLSKQLGGMNPTHMCLTVYYPKIGKTYDIAEKLMEVICEC